ncbi:MAG TPA: YihA family ribosome biogenesis GTP-binding protein [Firmicutes bacterium]|nr:YihA family ribosome biogenesis GTP-binding protein [Bacillota bacterium]
MKLNFSRVQFIKSAPRVADKPTPALKELVFVGRSNVGKSSLINLLTGHPIAKVSGKPGKTIFLNYFSVDDKFYLVDAPGYGYTASGSRHTTNFSQMMEEYFKDNVNLKGVILLLDSRHTPSSDDLAFYSFVKKTNYPLVIVLTKTDKLNQKEAASFLKETARLGLDLTDSIKTSTLEKRGFDDLQARLAQLIGD